LALLSGSLPQILMMQTTDHRDLDHLPTVGRLLCLDKMPSVADSRLSDDGSGFFY
jgi:hypothetical protein